MKSKAIKFSIYIFCLIFITSNSVFAQDNKTVKDEAHTKEWRDSQTPDQVIELLKHGNSYFIEGKVHDRDFLNEIKHTSDGQHPLAAILSCIDSRVPAEIAFNLGIGDLFNARVAGNFVNTDIAGSLEYACKVAGSKVIVVMGHTACGAVKSACDGVELGNITHLLSNISPAIEAVKTEPGEMRNSKNKMFVKHVEKQNVIETIKKIREISPILKEMEDNNEIKIVGCMYDVKNGTAKFFE